MKPLLLLSRRSPRRSGIRVILRRLCAALVASAALWRAKPAAAGTLEPVAFTLPSLDQPMLTNLYRPEGPPPPGGWPVLYLLHGHDGNQHSWTDLGRIEDTLDRMIAEKRIRPLLVVMPDAQNSWYVNSRQIGGPGDYETAVARDLPAAIEAGYPVRKDTGGRAIAGLSMGGFGALRLAYTFPDRYAAVASLSGAIWQNVPPGQLDANPDALKLVQDAAYFQRVDRATITAGLILPNTGDHFSGSFGTPFDARRFNAENVFSIVGRQFEAQAVLPPTFLTSGDDDQLFLWRGAVALYSMLEDHGLRPELRITDGTHNWALWRTEITDVLAWIDGKWTDPPALGSPEAALAAN